MEKEYGGQQLWDGRRKKVIYKSRFEEFRLVHQARSASFMV